ncbi:MAG: Uma2 family endonuclease [Acidobacteria bacterium]|nr:Uma2 family endonuclease [Acidobacteriota bacterium]
MLNMASNPIPRRMTFDEALAAERAAVGVKSEFWLGQMTAMSGGTRPHCLIAVNLTGLFLDRLRGKPCQAFNSDMKVGVTKKRGFGYPDLTIACGEQKYLDDTEDLLMNPVIIFEVLSDSTRAFDRGEKFIEYQKLESLRHYVLVEQRFRLVEHFERVEGNEWKYHSLTKDNDVLRLSAVGVEVTVAEIYEGINVPLRRDDDEA